MAISLFAAQQDFEYSQKYSLEKDEKAIFKVRLKDEERWHDFVFFYTLNDSEKLTLITHYKGFARQYHIYPRNNLNYLDIKLLTNYNRPFLEDVRLFIKLDKMEAKSAEFSLFIRDQAAVGDFDFRR